VSEDGEAHNGHLTTNKGQLLFCSSFIIQRSSFPHSSFLPGMKPKRDQRLDLPPLELECMKTLWRRGCATVHQIRAELLPQRPLAYTTVMTVMNRLASKGAVDRSKHGRAHVYQAAVSVAEVREYALARLLENFFQDSRDELRRHLEGGPLEPVAMAAAEAPPALESTAGRAAPRAFRAVREESIDPSLL
jgi:predicted transcriptional regulator